MATFAMAVLALYLLLAEPLLGRASPRRMLAALRPGDGDARLRSYLSWRRNAALAPMPPHTASERWGWTALSVTAGVTEEVIWRGFGLTLLFTLLLGVLRGLLALLPWIGGGLSPPFVLHALFDPPPAWARNSIITGDEA